MDETLAGQWTLAQRAATTKEKKAWRIFIERKKEIKQLVLQSSPFYTTSDRQWRALRVESAMHRSGSGCDSP